MTDVEHLRAESSASCSLTGSSALDFAGALPGVLAIIDDDDVFPTVTVEPVARTISWPAGVDFDPDVLHGDQPSAKGGGPKLVRDYRGEPVR